MKNGECAKIMSSSSNWALGEALIGIINDIDKNICMIKYLFLMIYLSEICEYVGWSFQGGAIGCGVCVASG